MANYEYQFDIRNYSKYYPNPYDYTDLEYPEHPDPEQFYPKVHIAVKSVLVVSYILMMSICGVGNLLLCYVVYRFRRMRTTTNLLIGNLALSDFLVAVICVPFNFYYYLHQSWIFGRPICVLVSYLKATSLFVSINSLLAIAVDRYFVITRPLQPRMTKRTTIIVLGLIWILSTLIVIPTSMYSATPTFTMAINEDGSKLEVTQCMESWNSRRGIQAYTLTIFILEFVFPLIIMSVAYFLIAWRLWFRVIPGNYVTVEQERAAEKSKRKTVRMLIIVVALFAICWAPYYAVALLRDFYYASVPEEYYTIYLSAFYIAEALAISNSMFDTLIYVIFNQNFRKCVLQLDISRACIPGNPYAQSSRQRRSSNRRTGGTRQTVRSSPEPGHVNSRSNAGSSHNYVTVGKEQIGSSNNYVTVGKEQAESHELKPLVNGNYGGEKQNGSYCEVVIPDKDKDDPIAHV